MHYWKSGLLFALVAILGLTFAAACGDGDDNKDSGAAASESAEPALEPASLTFQLNWIPNIQHFGPVYAREMGFYKEVALDVKVAAGGQGIDGIALVVGGGADIAVSGAANIYAANEKGADLVAFAAVYQKSASALVCRGDSGVVKFGDLVGKKIGSRALRTTTRCPSSCRRTASTPKA
jgi:ABC-type nitrate/sulfonate/bicarbonate transport system substrate-binding protein